MISTLNGNDINENNFRNGSELDFDSQLYCTPRGSISEHKDEFKQSAFVRQTKFSATMKDKYFQLNNNNNNDNLKLKNDFIFDIEKYFSIK